MGKCAVFLVAALLVCLGASSVDGRRCYQCFGENCIGSSNFCPMNEQYCLKYVRYQNDRVVEFRRGCSGFRGQEGCTSSGGYGNSKDCSYYCEYDDCNAASSLVNWNLCVVAAIATLVMFWSRRM